MPKDLVLLAFDFGLRKIGVAVGQTVTQSASPLNTLRAQAGTPNWTEIHQLITEWQANALIVGLPLNIDNTEQNISLAAREFAKQLQEHFALPTYLVDERYSSQAAKSQLREDIGSPNVTIDSYAAKLILESWLRNKDEHDVSA